MDVRDGDGDLFQIKWQNTLAERVESLRVYTHKRQISCRVFLKCLIDSTVYFLKALLFPIVKVC
jgi:hypothetical protein